MNKIEELEYHKKVLQHCLWDSRLRNYVFSNYDSNKSLIDNIIYGGDEISKFRISKIGYDVSPPTYEFINHLETNLKSIIRKIKIYKMIN